MEVLFYRLPDGKVPVLDWLQALSDPTVRRRFLTRFDRLALGNFGDSKSVGGGVSELRFHFGPGYRVYFGVDNGIAVILLVAGDKGSQSSDIQRARTYWAEYVSSKEAQTDARPPDP